MRLEPALERWTKEGLIGEAEAQAIAAFEEARGGGRSVALMAIAGLGGLSVTLGLMALIGANWAYIPDGLKLGADGALGALLCAALWPGGLPLPGWARDVGRLLYAGWVLASIALIGQVFQLDGTWSGATLWWVALTAPVLSFSTSRYVASTWMAQLMLGIFAVLDVVSVRDESTVMAVLLIAQSALFVGGRLPVVRRHRPAISWAVTWGFGTFLMIGALSSSFMLQWGTWKTPSTVLGWVLGAALPLAAGVTFWRPVPGKFTWLALGATYLMCASIFTGISVGSELGSFLVFVPWMALVAAAGFERRSNVVFRAATLLLSMRLFILYVAYSSELTGLGFTLVGGGALLMGLAWFWHTKTRGVVEAA